MSTDKPSRTEEEYFTKRDIELLQQKRHQLEEEADRTERQQHFMKCPKCGVDDGVDADDAGLDIWGCYKSDNGEGCGVVSPISEWKSGKLIVEVDPATEAIARRVVELLVEGGYVGKE